jgi:hypothetical protein
LRHGVELLLVLPISSFKGSQKKRDRADSTSTRLLPGITGENMMTHTTDDTVKEGAEWFQLIGTLKKAIYDVFELHEAKPLDAVTVLKEILTEMVEENSEARKEAEEWDARAETRRKPNTIAKKRDPVTSE